MGFRTAFFIFIFPVFVFGQDTTAHKKSRIDSWEELNKRQDTVERAKPVLVQQTAEKDGPMPLEWGLLRVNDSLLVDQTEITVGEWLDYVFYHNASDTSEYIQWRRKRKEWETTRLLNTTIEPTLLPEKNILDQLPEKYLFTKCKNCELISFDSWGDRVEIPVEKDSIQNSESKKKLKAYLCLPVVGISYLQAVGFCNWRTRVDSLRMYRPHEEGAWFYRHDFIFRLPSPAEFDQLYSILDSTDKKGSSFNYKGARSSKNTECGKSRMFAYLNKNEKFGTYNIQGNVAEMTTIKGISRGGSYMHFAKESYKGIDIPYYKPEPWLGFRCVVVRSPRKQKDSCIYVRHKYPNGNLEEEGCELHYASKGLITIITPTKEGLWKEYLLDGSLSGEFTYKNDKLTGPYKKYYKNGVVHETGMLLDYQSVDTMRIYDEAGLIISEVVWKLSGGGYDLISEKLYRSDAKPDNTMEVIDGENYYWLFGEKHKEMAYPVKRKKKKD